MGLLKTFETAAQARWLLEDTGSASQPPYRDQRQMGSSGAAERHWRAEKGEGNALDLTFGPFDEQMRRHLNRPSWL
jgi:hypothetical protein